MAMAMAAVPLSNRYSLSTPTRLIAFSISKSHQRLRSPLSCKPNLGLSRSLPNSPFRFRSLCTVKETAVETSDEDEVRSDDLEESGNDADPDSSPSLKSLLELYKEAIVNGDEKTTSDIETSLYHIENEKNKLLEQVTSFSAETSSGREKYIRLQADFDNFRKRSEKEKLTVRSNAQGEVIESLLPMVDNFERAKQQLKIETEQEKKIDASYQGIYKQFVEIMRSLRVAVVPTVGKSFDPTVHEAIAREESNEFNEGIVMEEFRRGFVLEGRLLRPAMVKVSAGPGRPKFEAIDGATATSAPESTDSNEEPQTAGLGQR